MTKSLTYIEIDIPTFVSESPEAIQTWRFAMPTGYLPADIDAIPLIDSVSFTPARISLGKDLGERASLRISLRDDRHIFNGEPFEQGTFFGKWRGRYGTKLRGRELRLIRGQVGQTIEQMDIYYYVIESTDGPDFNGVYTIEAKDILKFADDDRAQAPALSNGSLAGSIDNAAVSLTLSPVGVGDLEYPASGWACLGGKEVVAFTRSADVLTITRAQFGTVAEGHDSGDRAQLVLRYTGDDAADIIYELLTDYAGVPAEYIDLEDWQEETAAFLAVIYARTITEPTSVRKLVSELIEQAALAVYWDDRAQRLRLAVLREISTDTATFGHERILEGSLKVKEQPGKRISQIWTYYGQRDPTDSAANEDNFRAVLADVDLDRETDYGSAEIRKVQAQWVETETAASRLNSIQLSRFRDPPRSFAFEVFRDVAITPAGGYQLAWWGNQDSTGVEQPALIQITHVRVEPDRVYVEAEEMLASGVITLVNVVFLLNTGGVLEWDVPETWNDADNAINVIGGGGKGSNQGSGNQGGKGGGGGAFSRSENVSLSGSPSTVEYRVGAGGATGSINGGDSWFGGPSFGSSLVAAEGGEGGVSRASQGQGGQAANGIGDLKTSGGDGGNGGTFDDERGGGGGGAGAAGPNGDGGNGGNNQQDDNGSGAGGGGADGGETGDGVSGGSGSELPGDGGNNRFGFGAGTSGQPSGQQGGGGRGGGQSDTVGAGGAGEQIWTQTVAPIISAGPGGGGGGGREVGGNRGGEGGPYGGGGGGGGNSSNGGGDGYQGIIVIRWREAEGSPA
jgi:hypothetical protein